MNTVRWRLNEFLEAHNLSVYALIHASELSPNTVYEIARGKSRQARLETLGALLGGLEKLTGEPVGLTDVLEYEPEAQTQEEVPDYLAIAGMFDDPDSPGDVSARVDEYLQEGALREHEASVRGER